MKTCPACQIRYPDALQFCPRDGASLSGNGPRGGAQSVYDGYLGTTIDGRYLIEAKLGEGGMGVVYAARHVIIDKRVAIKVLKKEAQDEESAGQRFIQEARSASKIGHANIVDITDFGIMPDGSAFFVMEFLEGEMLGKVIGEGPLAPARAIKIAAQIARGLHAAHKHEVVHRDLKPDNVFLVGRDGQTDIVKIVDFGIAKVAAPAGTARLTQVGMVLGTPEYMSPEQATGKETDHRVDEYALGCILYEMITGEVPFRGNSSAATLTKHVFDAVEPPHRRRPDLKIPPILETVTLKAMSKKPDDRYPSMLELLAALDAAAAEVAGGVGVRRRPRDGSDPSATEAVRGVAAPEPTASVERIARRPGPRGVWVVAAGAVLVLGAGGWILHTHGGGDVTLPAVEAAPPIVTPPVPAPPPVPALGVPAQVLFMLRSTPEGAGVYHAEEKVGETPVTYRAARGGPPIEFVFRLAGYRDVTRSLAPDGDHDVEVALIGKPERGRGTRPGRGHAAAVAHPRPAKAPRQGVSDLRDPFR